HAIQPGEVLFPAFFLSENGERGRNLLRGREALPAQPEKPFSARSGRGSDVQMAQRMELT
ncbi:hypothetical protein, partial [Escherichia coli]|uniref:hypothetical protein n=1 Tax=Escherichia coli TaxID=562 RepID=UPI001BDD9089